MSQITKFMGPDGPHVGLMNLAIGDIYLFCTAPMSWSFGAFTQNYFCFLVTWLHLAFSLPLQFPCKCRAIIKFRMTLLSRWRKHLCDEYGHLHLDYRCYNGSCMIRINTTYANDNVAMWHKIYRFLSIFHPYTSLLKSNLNNRYRTVI